MDRDRRQMFIPARQERQTDISAICKGHIGQICRRASELKLKRNLPKHSSFMTKNFLILLTISMVRAFRWVCAENEKSKRLAKAKFEHGMYSARPISWHYSNTLALFQFSGTTPIPDFSPDKPTQMVT
ncbi:hypothetical protein J6590_105266 [Homalodisca vitripennis]|nr:hypothetical protein J6590_105266 [Homalodisca vitripennis]